MKKIAKYISAIVLCFVTFVAFAGCNKDPKIVNAYLKSGTIETTIVKGETLDTSNAVAIVAYSDDKIVEVPSKDLKFGTIDTNVVGTHDLKITYSGYEFIVKIKVVATEADVTVITMFFSQLQADFLNNSSDQKTNEQEEFTNPVDYIYVGDDNLLDFRINASGKDREGNLIHNLQQVRTNIQIEKISGTDNKLYLVLTNDQINDIAVIDNLNNTIDFKESAVGNDYRITVTAINVDPTIYDEDNPASFSIEVKVVDGYNVYNAKDLSLLDNTNTDNAWQPLKEEWGLANINPANLILQSTIVVERENDIDGKLLPDKNFYSQEEVDKLTSDVKNSTNQEIVGSLKDTDASKEGLYVRNILDNEEFKIYGNYFDIDCSNLPPVVIDADDNGIWVADETIPTNSYITTHTPIFRFNGGKLNKGNRVEAGATKGGNSTGNIVIQDIYFKGNGRRTSDPISSGGAILMKARACNFEANNIIERDFFIGYYTEYGYSVNDERDFDEITDIAEKELKNNGNPERNNTFRFINCKAYNNYNTGAYIWGSPNVYLEGCEFIGFGGPAIITDHATGDSDNWRNNYNKSTGEGGYPSNIDIVACNIQSLVNGDEGWFITYQVKEQIATITAADKAYNQFNKTFLTNNGEASGFMNMIIVHKYGAKSFSESLYATRGYVRMFDSIKDYQAYYETNKLVNGSNYYGYDRSMSYDQEGNYIYNAKTPSDNRNNVMSTGEFGRIESDKTGEAFVLGPNTPTALTYADANYLNFYLSNGFGLVLQLYDKTSA